MKLFKAIIFGIIFTLTTTDSAIAQSVTNSWEKQLTVTGIVSDEYGIPLPGAIVQIKGSANSGVQTDVNGFFSITAEKGKILIISFIGMETIERQIVKPEKYRFSLKERYYDDGPVQYAKYSQSLRHLGVASLYMFNY